MIHWGGHNIIYIFLMPKMLNLKLTMGKSSYVSKLRDMQHNNLPEIFKTVNVTKDKKMLKHHSQLKRLKRYHDWKHYMTQDWVLHQIKNCSKGHILVVNLAKFKYGLFKNRRLFEVDMLVAKFNCLLDIYTLMSKKRLLILTLDSSHPQTCNCHISHVDQCHHHLPSCSSQMLGRYPWFYSFCYPLACLPAIPYDYTFKAYFTLIHCFSSLPLPLWSKSSSSDGRTTSIISSFVPMSHH